MTSPGEPDPNRSTTRSSSFPKTKSCVSISWSQQARQEYSGVRSPLNSTARKAVNATLRFLESQTKALNEYAVKEYAVDLSFVSSDEICQLNQTYRGKNKPTDVLSFSQLEGDVYATPVEQILLGDIVIGIGVADMQAKKLEHDLAREITFLVIHGTLHLCGYDHDTSSRRRTMWKLQDTIFESLIPTLNSSRTSSC